MELRFLDILVMALNVGICVSRAGFVRVPGQFYRKTSLSLTVAKALV
jgi:hypothetical protein